MRESIPMAEHIRENLSIIATYAFSRRAVVALQRNYHGHFRYFDRALEETPRLKATRACIDLAVCFRILDDDHAFDYIDADVGSAYRIIPPSSDLTVGVLRLKSGVTKPLTPREMCNKIIHAQDITWDNSDLDNPKIVCRGRDDEGAWLGAEIFVNDLVVMCAHYFRHSRQ